MASVRLFGRHVGELRVDGAGSLAFRYAREWNSFSPEGGTAATAAMLSLSLPPRGKAGEWLQAGPFFQGLLPDSPITRNALSSYFGIDPTDHYGLLVRLGRECQGAVTIDPVDGAYPQASSYQGLRQLDERTLSRMIDDMSSRPLFVDAVGEFRATLAGVQNKAAVIATRHGVALPDGETSSTHILKIDIAGLPDSCRVENFCLKVAAAVGIRTVASGIRTAEGKPYLLVARYDRSLAGAASGRFIRRTHQEDFAQALGLYPRQKYEKDGGPGWRECFGLMDITANPSAYRAELLSRAIFQYLIGNPDAHAKNYALVYRGDGAHLSHIYDVNNAAAFRSHYKVQKTRLAMSVGGERDPEVLTADHWVAFSNDIGESPDIVQDRLRHLSVDVVRAATEVRRDIEGTIADSPLLDTALDDIAMRCSRVIGWNLEKPQTMSGVPSVFDAR